MVINRGIESPRFENLNVQLDFNAAFDDDVSGFWRTKHLNGQLLSMLAEAYWVMATENKSDSREREREREKLEDSIEFSSDRTLYEVLDR